MATLGLSKVFILDKYFTELQKFWETEKKLQDASSSNEAVHLQQRLKSLSTELVTLRNRLHVGQGHNTITSTITTATVTATATATVTATATAAINIVTTTTLTATTTNLSTVSSTTSNIINGYTNAGNNFLTTHLSQNHLATVVDNLETNNITNCKLNYHHQNVNQNYQNHRQQQQQQQQQQQHSHHNSHNNNHHHPFANNINCNLNNNLNFNNFNANIQQQYQQCDHKFATINHKNNNNNNNHVSNSNINNNTNNSNNINNIANGINHAYLSLAAVATAATTTTITTASTTALGLGTQTIQHTLTSSTSSLSSPGINGINTTNSFHNNNKNTIHSIAHQTSLLSTNVSIASIGPNLSTSRNTSIPHPLPHQINENELMVLNNTSASSNHLTQNLYHTLPLRSTNHMHNQNRQLPFVPVMKHLSSNLHNGFGNAYNLSLPYANIIPGSGSLSTSTFNRNSINHQKRKQNHQVNNQYVNQLNNVVRESRVKLPIELDDLIHLSGPLTEDAVMRTLQARFNDNYYFTNVGPILLAINPYLDVGNPLTLTSTRSLVLAPQLCRIVQEAVRQQAETGYPQAVILSGMSGAGKTHCSMLLLRQLFAVAGGGPETDAFKHLAAAFTVLRSLGSAKTFTNSESSRIGQFIEVQVTDGALYRTKIHCYFLDQTRVIHPLSNEKNYHIFYQMLAGLSRDERIKLNLEGFSPTNLSYLKNGDINQDEQEDSIRFQAWKTSLGILGIPFFDVMRVLAAVLLLGNVQFVDGQSLEVDVKGESELNAVANLLGVPADSLFCGITTRTHNARGQLIKSVCDANMSNMTRDSLAKALYCRTVATIVRRANSLKRLGSTLGTLSSDSNESVHNQGDIVSQHTSTVGGNTGSKSMAALNNAVRHATDGFIGILDMFGFEQAMPHAQLEHLCINLCAETMQHFYNTHIFKSSIESCRDEGIICDTEVDYVDNVPCIDLISSLRTGLLSMLDKECSVRGTAEGYVAKIRVQHRHSPRLESKHSNEPHDPRMFMIRHFASRVEYDATDFLDTNRDVVPDDLVAVFYKHTCNFGFATHLFGSELKSLYTLQNVPRGLSFRIAPTSHTDLLNGDEPVSTLTQDFHTRLDNLLRTLVHARPHFVRCIRSNSNEASGCFERLAVINQIRSLQVLETVNLMASGFPHRMRFKQFNARYRMLAPFHLLRHNDDKIDECCSVILQYTMENPPLLEGSVTLAWASGKRHVFLSEGMRQHLEHLRTNIRNKSAKLIQATWRGWQWRKKTGNIKTKSRSLKLSTNSNNNKSNHNNSIKLSTTSIDDKAISTVTRLTAKNHKYHLSTTNNARPRPQPITGTPPPDPNEKCDAKLIQQTCTLFGLDLERPPPVPPSRNYTITGNTKLGFPQNRLMKVNYPEDLMSNPPNNEQLKKGETVNVIGVSSCRGHLIVEHKGHNFHIPYQYMELIRYPNIGQKETKNKNSKISSNGKCTIKNSNNNSTSISNSNNNSNSSNNNNNINNNNS